MAKFSMKKGGKEVGPASIYAEPHTMAGGAVSMKDAVTKPGNPLNEMNISVGGISKGNAKDVKTDGITMRGYGAATKGIKSRGPMA